jgi:hypothetical protein
MILLARLAPERQIGALPIDALIRNTAAVQAFCFIDAALLIQYKERLEF